MGHNAQSLRMATVRDLLATPSLAGLSMLGASGLDREVRDVALVEELGDLARVGRGSFVVLARGASRAASTYRFDVAIRRAAARGVACLAILEPWARSLSATAAALAERAGLALVAIPGDRDLGSIAAALGGELLRGARGALAQIEEGLEGLLQAAEQGDLEAVAGAAGRCLARPVRVGAPGPDEVSVPVEVLGETVAWLSTPAAGARDAVARLVLALAAYAVAASLATARWAEELPERSRAELLTELLAATGCPSTAGTWWATSISETPLPDGSTRPPRSNSPRPRRTSPSARRGRAGGRGTSPVRGPRSSWSARSRATRARPP
jgi:hypothetical protein